MNQPEPRSDQPTPLHDTLTRIALLQSAGLHAESGLLCSWVLEREPDSAMAHHLMAIAQLHATDLHAAIDSLDRALRLDPGNGALMHLYGVSLAMVGDLDKAVEVVCAALAIDRGSYDSWNLLADCLLKLESLAESEQAARTAIELDPARYDAFVTLSRLATAHGAHRQAELILDHAIGLARPVPMSLRVRRLAAALQSDNMAYLEAHLDQAILEALDEADLFELTRIKAWSLFYQGLADDAIALLERAVQERFDPGLLSLLSLILSETDRVGESVDIYERMLVADPSQDGIRFNLSLSQLSVGQVAEGLANYEARWKTPSLERAVRTFRQPQWQGEPLAGKRILLWGEQGLGDQIRHASMVHEIRDLGAEIAIECNHKLIDLFRATFPYAQVGPFGPAACEGIEAYDGFDLHSPLGSIARLLRRDIADFRAKTKPWLVRDRARERAYGERFRASPEEILVGICWRSGTLTSRRQMSYLTIGCFEKLAALTGVRLVALQYDMLPLEIEEAGRLGLPMVVPDVDQRDDLVSASHVIGACDLVISATTSVTDLAGAMGKPLLIFGGKISWTRMGQADNPWYANNRYLCLDPDNPSAVVDEVVSDWDRILEMIRRDRERTA